MEACVGSGKDGVAGYEAQRKGDGEHGTFSQELLGGAASAGVLGAMAGLTGCAPQASSASAKNGDASSADAAVARPTYYMCDEDWLGSAPEIADADIKETKSFDVVVVGGGHAGTQAALAAAQEGAKVAVIEKHNDGEIVYRGDDICSYNSKMLEAWGFGPYDLDEIVNEYVRRANGRCNTEVIRSFVYNSGEMMDNLASLIPTRRTCSTTRAASASCRSPTTSPAVPITPWRFRATRCGRPRCRRWARRTSSPWARSRRRASRACPKSRILPRARPTESGGRMVLRADRGALRAGCRRRC